MRSTDVLREEHKAIKRMLNILEAVAGKLGNGGNVDPAVLEAGVDFVRNFADKCHHGKEETLLFPVMEGKGFARDSGPLGQMLSEHVEGRAFVKGIADSTAAYKRGDASAIDGIIENVHGYVNMLRRHIDKEDFILFGMADRVLSDEEDEELMESFGKADKAGFQAGAIEGYHRMVEEFEGRMGIGPEAVKESTPPGCLAFADDMDAALDQATREATTGPSSAH